MTETNTLTDSARWDEYWHETRLPVEVAAGDSTSTTAILEVLDRFAGSKSPLSVVEVGGAPGGYLVHLWRRFGHHVSVLDSSEVGTRITHRNFELLGVPGQVIHGDLLALPRPLPQFDVVYSLGLIEHFTDTAAVIAAHLELLRPGGTLIVGCPNFRGVNLALLRHLSPSLLEWHNLDAMDISRWPKFERRFGLGVKFRDYVAGFQPGAFWRCEGRSVPRRALARSLGGLGSRNGGRVGRWLSRRNSRLWSYYAMAAYEKSSD